MVSRRTRLQRQRRHHRWERPAVRFIFKHFHFSIIYSFFVHSHTRNHLLCSMSRLKGHHLFTPTKTVAADPGPPASDQKPAARDSHSNLQQYVLVSFRLVCVGFAVAIGPSY